MRDNKDIKSISEAYVSMKSNSALNEQTLKSATSTVEQLANSPVEISVSFDSFDDFIKKEVGKVRGRYHWAGSTYPNKQMLKKDVESSIKNSGTENKRTAQAEGKKLIQDMKRGNVAIAFSERSDKRGKIYIVSQNDLITVDNIRQFRKEVFSIEDQLDASIEWLPITYKKYSIK